VWACVIGILPVGVAHAEKAPQTSPVVQEQKACEKQEQRQGTAAPASAVECAVKIVFQNRIRRRKDDEPVEMTAGSPPLQSDDTETPGARNLEINLGLHGEFAGSDRRIEGPMVELNYGLGDTLQVSYGVPYVIDRQSADGSGAGAVDARGIGDSALGLKYRFYDNQDSGVSFAIAPELEFRTPGGNHAVSEGTTLTVLPFIMTREFAHASFTANAGVEFSQGNHREFGSFGVGRRVSDRLVLLGEVAGNDLNAADEKRILLQVGVRRKLSGSQSLSAALGRDVYAGGEQHRQDYLALNYQKIFGD
jgi:hypothetical protein